MPSHLVRPAEPHATAETPITRLEGETGIALSIVRLAAGDAFEPSRAHEGALLLLEGEATFAWEGSSERRRRRSVFDEDPVALHYAAGARARIVAESSTELIAVAVESEARLPTALLDGGSMAGTDHRGRGQLDDTAYRLVKTVFDRRNRPGAGLVLGEVVTLPGRWSSWPPHHHPQPELYHYRFAEPSGYGHGEVGDEVYRVRTADTLIIPPGRDHAQVAAPGYAMWYLFVIRNLSGCPYTEPEFAPEHRWMLEPQARAKMPKGVLG